MVTYTLEQYAQENFEKRRHLISVSYFFLENVNAIYAAQKCMTLEEMQQEYEKKKQYYKKGLDDICRDCGNDTNVVIFCDSSSYDDAEKYLEYSHVMIMKYEFPQFKKGDYHAGFFGTLMRYIPLFEMEDFPDVWETTTVLDLDNHFAPSKKLMDYWKKNAKTNLIFWTRPMYYLAPRMYNIPMKIRNYSIISSFMMQKNRKDAGIFFRFINECLLKDDAEYMECLANYLPIKGKREFSGKLEYGVDEYFINKCFLGDYYGNGEQFEVIMYREVFGGMLEWMKHMRYMRPKPEITNNTATTAFLREAAKIFFPKEIKIAPKKKAETMMEWVAETYYGEKLQFTQRKEDSTDKIAKLVAYLDANTDVDKHREILDGLKLNLSIFHNEYGVFTVNAKGQCEKIGVIAK